mmetsp:Transcript_50596/g.56485  ORF Transcript_50596/g.56485 Transcript_50596/m.56485 type:complete len:292 (-) Transcript_50596:79-954(-)
MTTKNNEIEGSSLTIDKYVGNVETMKKHAPQQLRRNSTRKRKSGDIIDDVGPDKLISYPGFTSDLNEKPVLVNSRDAFFDNNSRRSLATICSLDDERIIKPSKSFFDDHDDDESYEVNNNYSSRKSPSNFQKRPLLNSIVGDGSPCGVDDFFYGCNVISSWKRPLAWSDEDDDEDNEDEENDNPSILGIEMKRQDTEENIREHLSFPKTLGEEFVSLYDESREVENSGSSRRMIRRSSSSRVTTLEENSRHKLPGSKMFRQTDISKVTAIHWDEKVMDDDTLGKMAKLSFS